MLWYSRFHNKDIKWKNILLNYKFPRTKVLTKEILHYNIKKPHFYLRTWVCSTFAEKKETLESKMFILNGVLRFELGYYLGCVL